MSVSLRQSDHWRQASLVTFHLRLSITIKPKYLSTLPGLAVGLRRPNANTREVTSKLTSCATPCTRICPKRHTLMENLQNISELWLEGTRVLDWAKTLEELQINSSDFRQSLSAPLVYEPVNLSFTASLSAVFIIAFILRGSVQVNSPFHPSLLQPCKIIFCSIRCCEPLTSISSPWQSEIRRLLQSWVPSSSTSSYGGVKSQGALEGHRGLGLHPPLWSLCSSHFICWRAFNLLFHARRLSISNGSFILNAMINSFHPKGLGEKWHSFCISDS